MNDTMKGFRDSLIEAGLIIPSAARGVTAWSTDFERIVRGVDAWVSREARSRGSVERFFPPVVARDTVRRSGYMENLPHLCGAIHSFEGDEEQHLELARAVSQGGDWTSWLRQTDVVLCPAACYAAYPTLDAKVPREGHRVTVTSFVFRREPSNDPARLQSFRMREDVCVGAPEQVQAWRDEWLDRASALFVELGLESHSEVANDPFFGRAGRILGKSQRAQALKFELRAPIATDDDTAIASFNYHIDHLTRAFELMLGDGAFAHSACIGFGLERVALALLRRHGVRIDHWPATVKRVLWPEGAS